METMKPNPIEVGRQIGDCTRRTNDGFEAYFDSAVIWPCSAMDDTTALAFTITRCVGGREACKWRLMVDRVAAAGCRLWWLRKLADGLMENNELCRRCRWRERTTRVEAPTWQKK